VADLCDPRIRETLEVIESRLAEPLQIAMLAAAVSLSVSRFTHLFTSCTGVSPLRHLRLRRLERARQLLERTAVSIERVRASVGYTDPSHFSKDFRRHFGVGPREYRRDYRRGLKKG
jgi:AraC family transcriptional regulator, arabinose operon regulatory protein